MIDLHTQLDDEIELIRASLLPAEELTTTDQDDWPRVLTIDSKDSKLSLQLRIQQEYPSPSSLQVEIRGDIGKDEAEEWRSWTAERLKDWQAADE
ncbi:hypothetical protein BD324DRAFT_616095 [Kockovaella imperatae]|uniref:Uncharacterized protein n=1 Tax=Kockovaella imperatae TaxID=4999 RepID=A0A1Y1UR40_9TREE|nr:hypothetical protein BD324DRAFT_616095 [Kockovaella imperatae]ORX40057.1 hypothetical protein BD324DRAFT_616095 [Kockovaella imperatae]